MKNLLPLLLPRTAPRRIRLPQRVLGAASLLLTAGVAGAVEGPCDIYAKANTPCCAAHATTRALFAAYNGPLYQVRRAKDNTTKDIPPMSAGGVVDASVQEQFCSGTSCVISIIYDQTSNHNDLKKSPPAHWLPNGGNEADASKGKIKVDGHTVYGIYVTAYGGNIAYRNNATKGVATGNQAESMYAIVDGKRYSKDCCFDYGNAEKSGNDDGNGTMEAIYWGTDVGWGGYGQGSGPWIAADLENGMFKGNAGGWQYGDTHKTPWPTAKSIIANWATLFLKGPSDNTYKIKAGNAEQGTLTTMWDGSRPSPGYSPKKLDGAIIIGTGGDGSNGGTGTFYEGAMTMGNPPDAVDEQIQANIVAAGYGRTTTSVHSGEAGPADLQMHFAHGTLRAEMDFDLASPAKTDLEIVDLRGHRVSTVHYGQLAAGPHTAAWDASKSQTGVYMARLVENGAVAWAGPVLVGR